MRYSHIFFALAGICAAFIFSVVWICASNADMSWMIGENSISDLGVSEVKLSVYMFKYGCIVCGILIFIFGFGKAKNEDRYNQISGYMISISGVFVVIVGVINKDMWSGNEHLIAAYAAFFLFTIGVILSGFSDWKNKSMISVSVTIMLLSIVIGISINGTIEMTEAISTICAIIWILFNCTKMILLPSSKNVN